MRHRDAWAEHKRSPTRAEWETMQAAPDSNRPVGASAVAAPATPRRIVVDGRTTAPAAEIDDDILVVASRLKAYIRARSGMNTSESVLEELSQIIRGHADRAIEHARLEGRKTVMDRDFKPD
jgi:hypothetical protein